MNERIRELAEQAGAEIYGHKDFATICVNGKDADDLMKKFAELIVRECLMLVHDRQQRAPTDDDGYFKIALDMVSKDIEQHFGVEE